MSLSGILLGVINIAIYVAIMILVGLIIVWFASWMQKEVPQRVQQCYMAIVFLVGLGMLVALLLGVPVHGPLSTGMLR